MKRLATALLFLVPMSAEPPWSPIKTAWACGFFERAILDAKMVGNQPYAAEGQKLYDAHNCAAILNQIKEER